MQQTKSQVAAHALAFTQPMLVTKYLSGNFWEKKTTWLCLITVMQVEVAKNSQWGLQEETQKLHFTLPYKIVSEYKEL